jgi:hypothetical protein
MSEYDKKERIVKFYTTLATYVKEINKAKQVLIGLDAQGEMHRGNKTILDQIGEQRKQVIKVQDSAQKLAIDYSNRRDLAGAEDLLAQLEARISGHEQITKGYHDMQASFELAVSMGEFAADVPGMTRADAESQIAAVKERGEKQLELANQLIPVRSTIIEIAS